MSDETQGTTETASTAETAAAAPTPTPVPEGQAETPAAADDAAGSPAAGAEAGEKAPEPEKAEETPTPTPASEPVKDPDFEPDDDVVARPVRVPPTPQERIDECKRYIEERRTESGNTAETHIAFLTELELAGKALLEDVLHESGVVEKDVSHYYKEGKAAFDQFVHKLSLHIKKPR